MLSCLALLPGAHLHVEDAAERVGVVGVEGRGEEVGVADDVGVQRAHHAEARLVEVVVVVGRKHLDALDAVLHHLRRIAVDRHAVAVVTARDTREGRDQSRRVVEASCKAVGLLHREHHAAHQRRGVHRRLLVDARPHHHLRQLLAVLAQGDVDDVLLGAHDELFLHHARLVAHVAGLHGVAPGLSHVDAVVSVDVGHGGLAVLFCYLHRCPDERFAADGIGHRATQGLGAYSAAADGPQGYRQPSPYLSHVFMLNDNGGTAGSHHEHRVGGAKGLVVDVDAYDGVGAQGGSTICQFAQ